MIHQSSDKCEFSFLGVLIEGCCLRLRNPGPARQAPILSCSPRLHAAQNCSLSSVDTVLMLTKAAGKGSRKAFLSGNAIDNCVSALGKTIQFVFVIVSF
jgi:hypothetical protein